MPAKRILVADDEMEILELLKDLLDSEGYKTSIVLNGEEAIEAVNKNPFDVALLDLHMPIVNGIEALKRIKELDKTIEVIIMTGYGDLDSLNEAMASYSAFDYILKPFTRENIIQTIEKAIQKREFLFHKEKIDAELRERIKQLERDFEKKTYELRESQIKYRTIIDNSNDAIVVAQEGVLKFVNLKALELTGYSEKEIGEIPFTELIHPEDRSMVMEKHLRRLRGEKFSSTYPFRILKKDGKILWVEINSVKTEWEGSPATLNIIRDISERKMAEEKLLENQAMLEGIVSAVPDSMTLIDENYNILWANDISKSIFGSEISGIKCYSLFHSRNEACSPCIVRMTLEDGKRREYETEVSTADGKRLNFWCTSSVAARYPDGRPRLVILVSRDITERKRAEQKLRESERIYRELSIKDGLTNLYNSRYFHEQLRLEVERSNRYGHPLSLMLLDIDNFKQYNDLYGHLEGDEVLVKLSEIIMNSLRIVDSAYRFGGEEFMIILPETVGEMALHVAERIRKGFAEESFSPSQGVKEFRTVSIGIAQYHFKEEAIEFIRRADRAMYEAKRMGKNRIFFSR